jgi:hypothetical protein
MSDKMRSIQTKFWDDSFIQDLSPNEKLLFLYLLTNPLTNIIGIYEITIKRITFDTGLKKETILKALESFGMIKKVFYIDNYIILPNFLKNQRFNKNMKVGSVKIFNQLPKELIDKVLNNGVETITNDSEGFEMIRNSMLKYEIEIEKEIESKRDENYKDFYDSEIENNGDLIDVYKQFVNFLFGNHKKNPIGKPLIKLLKMKDQIGYDNFCKLYAMQTKEKRLIDKCIAYYNGNYKNSSFFLTMNEWMKKEWK